MHLLVVVGTCVQTSSLNASQLIASFDFFNGGGFAPCQMGSVEFYLGIEGPPPLFFKPIGAGQSFWVDGDSGNYQIDSTTEPLFSELANVLSNGIDDTIFLLSGMQGCNGGLGGGVGISESFYFGMPTDLAGFEIEFVRIAVSNVHIETLDPELSWQAWTAEVNYEFWGTPVPEPAAFTLVLIAAILARPRRTQRLFDGQITRR